MNVLQIARSSLSRANSRITQEKNSITTKDAEAEESLQSELLQVQNVVSEVADDRPVVSCQFSANGESLATASWSGNVKIWDIPSLTMQKSFHAHDERITGVAWRPILNSRAIIATGSVDTSAKLWDVEKGLLRTFQGHGARLARIGFHPMGEHLGTASFDQTWRLWDIESGNCLLEQEGHSKAVYAIAFQNDGALAASGGLDAYCRVWDLRTGRCILLLEGHVKGILSADFSPNGYLLATGSEDHTSRVYDLRKKGTLSILPGHNSLVSQVRFEPLSGKYLLSAGYDNVGKIWYGTNFKLIKTLAGHDAKVMGGDIRPSPEPLIATVGYDRTVKLWESKGM